MELYTDRAARADDASWVVALHHLPHACPYVTAPTLERVSAALVNQHMQQRVVLDAQGHRAGLWTAVVHDGWLVEISRIIASEPRRKVGRWALRRAVEWAFDEVGAHRVYVEVTAANAGARKLYERFGFVQEGRFRDGYRNGEGDYEDLCAYGLLKRDPDVLAL